MNISLTDFVDFVITSGSPKLTRVRQVKHMREQDYDPAKDFWKPLRDRIVQFHRTGEKRKTALADVLTQVSPGKKERYAECLSGYRHFLGRKDFGWFEPPRSTWDEGTLKVSVNPELGLIRNGQRGVVKLYFKATKLSKRRVAMILLLMREGLRGRLARDASVGILDVPHGRLYSAVDPDATLLPLLEGEAESFARIWERI